MSNNTTMKYACEQFDGKMNFGIWQSTVKDILVQKRLLKPLQGNKPESMDQDDWEELQAKVVSTIRLNLAPKVKYQTLKTTLLNGKETLLVDDVMSALIDSSRVNGTSSSSQGEGLVVRSKKKNGHKRGRGRSRSRNPGHGKNRSKSRGKQDKFSIECWYCKEIGHIARKCPERKEKKNGKKHVNNANVAEEDDDKSSDGDLYLVSLVEQQEGDVRYIPDLKKNLISFGTLDSINYSIFIKGVVTKVSKGAMVIMKCQKTENLYKLIGNTVIGGASVSTHIELHEQRKKIADESIDGSIDEQSLEDPEEHPRDSWNLVRDRESRTKKPTQRKNSKSSRVQMGVIRSSFTFMVGAISRAYIAQNYHVPNIRKHYKSECVIAKHVQDLS
ncbi:hypothetical protein RJ640_001766 [Escallonia rubra]|uniref:CCHC-type domain-containing protein n=1 Tax=Escallonia rubra TaxID=112253 RepID=A0AA88S4W1_9ASTE|nr:hypothetical protein RJ640_001766 [Escallonia rubra]